MKKLFGILAAIAAMFLITSCGGGGNTPKGTAEQFIKAMQAQDGDKIVSLLYFEEGKGPSTDDEKAQLAALFDSKLKETYKNNGELKSYEILSEEISEDGKSAVVNTKVVFEKKTDEDRLKLKKDADGNWKVDVGK